MKKLKWRINIFDITVIIIVIIAAVLFIKIRDIRSTEEVVVGDTITLRYSITFTNEPDGLSDLISVGDELVDSVRGYKLGTVESMEVTSAILYTEDKVNDQIIAAKNPDHEDIVLNVVAEASDTETVLVVDGGYKIKAGNDISIKGAGYAISGYITHIERS